ncbi:MAG: MerR family transcriptional regulator [Anaerolineae bacterium]|nr:MerR family transcriptional regulator [Anaerolineae bacterium]
MPHKPDQIPMRELERITGFPRATILFYIKEGLLPEPQKTARNMAYYDRRFVAGLKLIREMRERHNLSLPQMKQVLQREAGGVDVALLLDVRDRLFRKIAADPDQPGVTWAQLLAETGLDEATLRRLAAMHLVFPQPQAEEGGGEPLYHPDNVVIGRLFKRAAELGIPLETLAPVSENLAQIAGFEVEAFLQHVAQPMIRRGESADVIWASIQIGMDLAHSLVSLLHLHTLHRLILTTEWPEKIAGEVPAHLSHPHIQGGTFTQYV